MAKIYTKLGDQGMSRNLSGEEISKDALVLQVIGNIDELNASLGIARAYYPDAPGQKQLLACQTDLFTISNEITAYPKEELVKNSLGTEQIKRLENEIDTWREQLPELTHFIIPGSNKPSAFLHIARTVARRAERTLVSLSQTRTIRPEILAYINRLSDWLFMLARMADRNSEDIWKSSP
jgi:cob(I)alamin adenosyltransferase